MGHGKRIKPGSTLLQTYKEAFIQIYTNKCTRWVIIGGCLRFWAGYTIANFAPKFFNIYPRYVVILTYLSLLIGRIFDY